MKIVKSVERSILERMDEILSDLDYCFDFLLDEMEGVRHCPVALRAASAKADRLAKRLAETVETLQ